MIYSEIIDTALDFADRLNDAEVSARINAFLRIVESKITRTLQVQKMTSRTYLATLEGYEYYTLPEDFNGIRDVEIKDALDGERRTTLFYLSPEQMNNAQSNRSLIGSNAYYTIIANQIQICPPQPAGKILEIMYYKGIRPLSTTLNENWVSIYYPDAYIFGLLVQISAFTKDADALAIWKAQFEEVMSEIESSDSKVRWSGTALQMRIG